MNKSYIIAIDGVGASGKSTITKKLASKLGFEYLLTGNLYRLVAKEMLKLHIEVGDEEKILEAVQSIDLENKNVSELQSQEIASLASVIAAYPGVRSALTPIQRNFAQLGHKGIVVEGRDIGSVIFPDANIKFFMQANLTSRAFRRYKELRSKGFKVIYKEILEDLEKRDNKDSLRSISPLMKADNAIVIDTSDLNIGETLSQMLEIIKEKSAFKL
jgi:cytidylate kinase